MTVVSIMLPDSSGESEQLALEEAIRQLDLVDDAGISVPRAIDPASVLLWVKLASTVIGGIGTAIPVIEKIVALIRGKGIRGARIELPGGARLNIDEASSAEIERLLKAAATT